MFRNDDRRVQDLSRRTATLLIGAIALFDTAAWAGPPQRDAIGVIQLDRTPKPTLDAKAAGRERVGAVQLDQTPRPTTPKSGARNLPAVMAPKSGVRSLPALTTPKASKRIQSGQRLPGDTQRVGPKGIQPSRMAPLKPGLARTRKAPGQISLPGGPGLGQGRSLPNLRRSQVPGLRADTMPLPIGGLPDGAGRRGGHGDGRDIHNAASAIREEIGRSRSIRLTSLSGFSGYEGQCANPGEPLHVAGHGFGADRGSQRIVLERRSARPGEEVPIAVATTTWSESRVTGTVPADLDEGVRYNALVRDAAGRRLSNSLPITACRSRGRVVVSLDTSWCAYSTANVIVEARTSSGSRYRLASMTGSHDFDVMFGRDDLPLGRYTIESRFRGDPCPGGTWSGSPAIHLSHDDPREDVTIAYNVDLAETRLGMSIVEGLLRQAFRGMQIRLNNYAPTRTGDSQFLAGDSFLDLPPGLGGRRIPLNVPEVREGAFRYYVRDLNLGGMQVETVGDRFHVRLDFESAGNELKGHCFGDVLDGCLVGSDDSAPDGHINGAHVDIFFDAIRWNVASGTGGDVTIGNVEVSMNADLAVNGILGPVFELLEGEIKGRVIPPLEANLRAQLSSRDFKNQVATALRSSAGGLIGSVMGVEVVGNDLVIRHVPRRS